MARFRREAVARGTLPDRTAPARLSPNVTSATRHWLLCTGQLADTGPCRCSAYPHRRLSLTRHARSSGISSALPHVHRASLGILPCLVAIDGSVGGCRRRCCRSLRADRTREHGPLCRTGGWSRRPVPAGSGHRGRGPGSRRASVLDALSDLDFRPTGCARHLVNRHGAAADVVHQRLAPADRPPSYRARVARAQEPGHRARVRREGAEFPPSARWPHPRCEEGSSLHLGSRNRIPTDVSR